MLARRHETFAKALADARDAARVRGLLAHGLGAPEPFDGALLEPGPGARRPAPRLADARHGRPARRRTRSSSRSARSTGSRFVEGTWEVVLVDRCRARSTSAGSRGGPTRSPGPSARRGTRCSSVARGPPGRGSSRTAAPSRPGTSAPTSIASSRPCAPPRGSKARSEIVKRAGRGVLRPRSRRAPRPGRRGPRGEGGAARRTLRRSSSPTIAGTRRPRAPLGSFRRDLRLPRRARRGRARPRRAPLPATRPRPHGRRDARTGGKAVPPRAPAPRAAPAAAGRDDGARRPRRALGRSPRERARVTTDAVSPGRRISLDTSGGDSRTLSRHGSPRRPALDSEHARRGRGVPRRLPDHGNAHVHFFRSRGRAGARDGTANVTPGA